MLTKVRNLLATTAPGAVLLIRVAVGWVFLSEGIQKFLYAHLAEPVDSSESVSRGPSSRGPLSALSKSHVERSCSQGCSLASHPFPSW